MQQKKAIVLAFLMTAATLLAGCTAIDSDGDGVLNVLDQCPNTPPGVPVDSNGCNTICAVAPKLIASDAAGDDLFGSSVSIWARSAIVGSPMDDDQSGGVGGHESGSAYIFACDGTQWVQEAKITASDADNGDYFGWSVDIYGDTAIVGAPFNDGTGLDSGSAYIFKRVGTTWTEEAILTADDAAAGDMFGISVATYDDTAVVGAHGDDGSITGASLATGTAGCGGATPSSGPLQCSIGAAYVFAPNQLTMATWAQEAKLTASDSSHYQYGDDAFGWDVDIYDTTIVVGSYLDNEGGGALSNIPHNGGSAYVFIRSSSPDPITGFYSWSEQAKLIASDALAIGRAHFGYSVSIHDNSIVIGAPRCFSGCLGCRSTPGQAYVFTRVGDPLGTTWTEEAILTSSDAPGVPGYGTNVGNYVSYSQKFGYDVGIWDNEIVVAAPPRNVYESDIAIGKGYIFTRAGTTWTEDAKLTVTDRIQTQGVPFPVGIHDTLVIIGSHNDDMRPVSTTFGWSGWDSGSAYICIRDQNTLICSWTNNPPGPIDPLDEKSGGDNATEVSGMCMYEDAVCIILGIPWNDACVELGCTDSGAENYNADATEDDDSCTYENDDETEEEENQSDDETEEEENQSES